MTLPSPVIFFAMTLQNNFEKRNPFIFSSFKKILQKNNFWTIRYSFLFLYEFAFGEEIDVNLQLSTLRGLKMFTHQFFLLTNLKYKSLFGILKGTVSRDFRHFFYLKKTPPEPHLNRQKRFHKYIRKKCVSA